MLLHTLVASFSGNQAVPGFTRDLLKKLLEPDGAYYKQVEGLGMELLLGPTLANIFMYRHEEAWIRDCPAAFATAKFLHYIGDTFVLFRHMSHIDFF